MYCVLYCTILYSPDPPSQELPAVGEGVQLGRGRGLGGVDRVVGAVLHRAGRQSDKRV